MIQIVDRKKFDAYLNASPSKRRKMKMSEIFFTNERLIEEAFKVYPLKETGEHKGNGMVFTNTDLNEEKRLTWLNGATYADQHPRKGLWDAEKACEILHEIINSDTIVQYLIFDDENIDFDSELFFDDLRKAMED